MFNIQNKLFRMNIENTEKSIFNDFSGFSVHTNANDIGY